MLLDLHTLPPAQRQVWLQHAIAPRPVAFVSTIDKEGNVNLSPFSFFNLFSSNPPIVVFSPARRVRDNTIKHTLENIQEIPEVVIAMADEAMVQQVSLASCEYPRGTNEFTKAGFTEASASRVRPPLIKESKINLECKVVEVKPLGNEGGAGNLVICEVLCMHINDEILNDAGTMIDQKKMHHIARLGGDWYCTVNENNLYAVAKPNTQLGVGVDALPVSIRSSKYLTGNHLGQLANVTAIPEIDASFQHPQLQHIVQYFSLSPDDMEAELHKLAGQLLNNGQVEEAWQVLLRTDL